METPIELVKRAIRTARFDEDGEPKPLELLPPVSDDELEQLRSRLPCAMPAHVRELLQFCRGFEGSSVDVVDFSGELPYSQPEIFPDGLPIAGDGFGNFWVVDLDATSEDFGPVFFACHDPPVIALQSFSLAGFIRDLLFGNSDTQRPIHFVHEEATFRIWKSDPIAITQTEAVSSGDAVLKEFASRLPETFLVADLREASVGDGFSWGRFGHDGRIVRHQVSPIFAYGPNR